MDEGGSECFMQTDLDDVQGAGLISTVTVE
jgi:hypothetical protein